MLIILARGDFKNKSATTADSGRTADPVGKVYSVLSGGYYVDPLRVVTHPSFSQVSGEGIYEYFANPDDTYNFALAPVRRIDTTIHKTLVGSVLVRQAEDLSDVVITEVWRGGDKLSTLATMYHTLYNFWMTPPDIGEYVTWEPKDMSNETYQIEIIDVQLGGQEANYRELGATIDDRTGAYLTQTLTFKFKLARVETLSMGTITLAGI
jgi:hypothetical protein